ncbi:ParB N-terminal domain-containing protein [Candidatus Enterovibrio altilux]|uniref:ParB-like N-terminal domain-containing protein n=2 Tax=Candidatus Enterovibrio altilux TaxID=1927128 RepID=A0A291B941_9GAMM|nr:hypothetical protein BTN50_1016 [Candidatus Enterovibrio luxaltus]
MNTDALNELAELIYAQGIIQSLVLQQTCTQQYEIIVG